MLARNYVEIATGDNRNNELILSKRHGKDSMNNIGTFKIVFGIVTRIILLALDR